MAIPETPITRQEMYLDAIARNAGGGGGSALPAVTSADNGKVLSVVDGAWAADDKRFVVTLTPTNPDYSGTTDKTGDEIYNAYISGKEIWVRLVNRYCLCTFVGIRNNGVDLVAYVILDGENMLILAQVSGTAGRTTTALYITKIYQLTPMGS